MIFLKYKKQNNKGFTILETLVAIAIILIAITGPLDIIAHSLKASYYSRDEVTAFYLAQEAVEYARNQRDNNELDPNKTVDNWLTGVTGNASDSVNCLNGADRPRERACALVQDSSGHYSYVSCGSTCYNDAGTYAIKKFGTTDVYGAGGSSGDLEDTNFTREIYFTNVLDGSAGSIDGPGQSRNEVVLTVVVYWSNNFGSGNKFTITTHLFNWKIT